MAAKNRKVTLSELEALTADRKFLQLTGDRKYLLILEEYSSIRLTALETYLRNRGLNVVILPANPANARLFEIGVADKKEHA